MINKQSKVNKAAKDRKCNVSVKQTGVSREHSVDSYESKEDIITDSHNGARRGTKQRVPKIKGPAGPARAAKRAYAVASSLSEEVQRLEGEALVQQECLVEAKEDILRLSTINEILVKKQGDMEQWTNNPEGNTSVPERYFAKLKEEPTKFTIDWFMKEKKTDPVFNQFYSLVLVHFLTKGATPNSHREALRMMFSWGHQIKGRILHTDQIEIINHVYKTLLSSWWFTVRCWLRWLVPHLIYLALFFVVELVIETSFAPHSDGKWWKLHYDSIWTSLTVLYFIYNVQRKFRRRGIHVSRVKHLRDYCTKQKWVNDSLTGKLVGGRNSICVPIDEGATVELPDVSKLKCVCKQFHVGFSFGLDYVWIPRNCWHNELNALVTRQLQPRLPFDPQSGFEHMEAAFECLVSHIPPLHAPIDSPETTESFLNKYPVTRRAQIAKELDKVGILDIRVSGFSKIEVMTGKPIAKRKVRFISGFSDGYLAETGPTYYHWQKQMIRTYWLHNEWGKYTYTGGFTSDRVAAWFATFINRGYTFLLLDFGKFDSRNKTEVMNYLYRYYAQCFPPELYHKLLQTFNKCGTTKYGIKFSVEATVASGRIDTSMGNTLLSFLLITAVLHALDPNYVDEAYISALGDDNNTAMPEFHHTLEDIKQAGALFGHELDGLIIGPEEYHKIEYCNHRLWNVAPGRWTMAPKIGRLLSKTFITHRHVPDHLLQKHFNGVMLGFDAVRWMPVFRAVYETWMERHGRTGQRYYSDSYDGKQALVGQTDIDDGMVYDQFQRIYGFDPTELEHELTQLDYKLGSSYHHPLVDLILEADGVSYKYEFGDHVALYASQVVKFSTTKVEDFI